GSSRGRRFSWSRRAAAGSRRARCWNGSDRPDRSATPGCSRAPRSAALDLGAGRALGAVMIVSGASGLPESGLLGDLLAKHLERVSRTALAELAADPGRGAVPPDLDRLELQRRDLGG